MRVSSTILFAIVTAVSSPACAGVQSNVSRCLSLPEQLQRIDCFDEIIVEKKGESYISKILNSSNWNVEIYKSAINDRPIVAIYVNANEDVWYEGYGRINPVLMITCFEDETRFYVDFEKPITTGRPDGRFWPVTYRIDSNSPVETTWAISTSFTALGLWNPSSSIPFIKSLVGSEQFAFRILPVGQDAYTVTFPISNLDVAIEYIRLACRW